MQAIYVCFCLFQELETPEVKVKKPAMKKKKSPAKSKKSKKTKSK